MLKFNAIKETFFYTLGEILPRLIAFILLPIFTVYLSPADYGIINYTNTIMMVVFVLASLSLNTFVLRSYYEQKTELDQRRLIGNIFMFIFGFNSVLVLLQFLILPYILQLLKVDIPFSPYFSLSIINNFVDVIAIIPLVVYRVKQNALGFVILNLSRTMLQYISTYILIVYLHWGIMGSFYGRLFVNIPFILFYILVIYRSATFFVDRKQIKEALRFSLPLLPGALSYIVITSLDRVVLERYASLAVLGIYSVAYTLSLSLNIIIQGAYKAFEPKIFKAFTLPDFKESTIDIQKYYYAMIFAAGIGISLFSKEIFYIMASSSFLKGYLLVPVIVCSVVVSGLNLFLSTLLIAHKKQKYITYSMMIAAVLNLTLNLILIPLMGYFGAAISSLTSFLFINVYYHLKLGSDYYSLITRQISALLTGALIVFIIIFKFQDSVIGINEIVIKVLFFAIYCFFIIWLFLRRMTIKLNGL